MRTCTPECATSTRPLPNKRRAAEATDRYIPGACTWRRSWPWPAWLEPRSPQSAHRSTDATHSSREISLRCQIARKLTYEKQHIISPAHFVHVVGFVRTAKAG